MSEPFWVDTNGLDRGAGEYDGIGQRVRSVADGINASSEGYGDVWGDDSPGKKFAQIYLPARSDFLQGVFALGDIMGTTGNGIRTMSKNFDDTEHGATRLASTLDTVFTDSARGEATSLTPSDASIKYRAMRPYLSGVRIAGLNPTQQGVHDKAQLSRGVRVRGRRALIHLDTPEELAAERKRQTVATNRLEAMDEYLRGEYERRGLEYPEPSGPQGGERKRALTGPESLRATWTRLLTVNDRMEAAAEQIGLHYPGLDPTQPELQEAARRIADANDRLSRIQHRLEAKDDELHAEYERRGWDYESPWGPPVRAERAMAIEVSPGAPPPPVDPWRQAMRLSDEADGLREANDRLLAVDSTLRAASERLGWTYP